MSARKITDLSAHSALAMFDALCLAEDYDLHQQACADAWCLTCETMRSRFQVAREKAFGIACSPLVVSGIGRVS